MKHLLTSKLICAFQSIVTGNGKTGNFHSLPFPSPHSRSHSHSHETGGPSHETGVAIPIPMGIPNIDSSLIHIHVSRHVLRYVLRNIHGTNENVQRRKLWCFNLKDYFTRNSQGDQIANVNFSRRHRTRTSKYKKREPTSFRKLNDTGE